VVVPRPRAGGDTHALASRTREADVAAVVVGGAGRARERARYAHRRRSARALGVVPRIAEAARAGHGPARRAHLARRAVGVVAAALARPTGGAQRRGRIEGLALRVAGAADARQRGRVTEGLVTAAGRVREALDAAPGQDGPERAEGGRRADRRALPVARASDAGRGVARADRRGRRADAGGRRIACPAGAIERPARHAHAG